MSEIRLVCGTCGALFAERDTPRNPIEPEQARCPECGSTDIKPDAFDPDAPVEGEPEDEAGER